MLVTTPPIALCRLPRRSGGSKFPAQVEMILSAIETGQFARRERREVSRAPYRVEAYLRLFSDLPDTDPWLIYTRDANDKGLGFITAHRLPLGYGGILDIEAPDGQMLSIQCTLLRCREAAPGWFEGSLYFNRMQPEFGEIA
jgi:hypothetical protein